MRVGIKSLVGDIIMKSKGEKKFSAVTQATRVVEPGTENVVLLRIRKVVVVFGNAVFGIIDGWSW